MIHTLLIANRGEIACRVIRTARRMGMRTVAVYSDADAEALHVREADAALRIGPADAARSYLDADAIVGAARLANADAVHPGYGFLSESTALVEACADAGVVFVGPPVAAIRAMGRKDAAQARMAEAGVPVLPGYRGAAQDDETLRGAADALGYPLIVKPSAGGGGKGMRVVRDASDLAAALESARREASGAFGDAHLVLERYLERPRHVEIQVFSDTHGHAVHLLERDCSIQRRHQKVVEEAPAPGLPESLRERMGTTGVRVAEAIGYVGAGTVEFLLDAPPGEAVDAATPFYFMEMNTRLQVEHPVTEMVLGLDLVEWQLRVAAGEPLPLAQEAVRARGHAVEVRIYAEDPQAGFLPSTGRIAAFDVPRAQGWLRLDTGVTAGDEISVHYDPMIAKLIAHGDTRTRAIERLVAALAACDVTGPATNLGFLERLVAHPAFAAGEVDTGFIERHAAELLAPAGDGAPVVPVAALAATLSDDARRTGSAHRGSPWTTLADWRLNEPRVRDVTVEVDDTEHRARIERGGPDSFTVTSDGTRWRARVRLAEDGVLAGELDEARLTVRVRTAGDALRLHGSGLRTTVRVRDPNRRERASDVRAGQLASPMPGRVVKVLVGAGDAVEVGQALVVVEAMKMEHTIASPRAGRVASVRCGEGDQVAEGIELVTLEDEAKASPGGREGR